ncbi:oxygen-independent coproporphyrinogen III oxidase [Salinimonas lutimaris]|uniref:oxygen-independent coproporphyrinogen III oxidase n=1 Tax=Salinimonas lutimaris TaxID=914153 RepID=UPI0010BFE5A0|nr:oxygen-independent coproporphyrinogen III oxidase [Salinimonas lutimaris]
MHPLPLAERRLINKYNVNGPRYTSYPTALQFHQYDDTDLLLTHALLEPDSDYSVYVHIPFCQDLCYYCGCNKQVSRQQEKADRYLSYLEKELRLRNHLTRHAAVRQIHLGGGSPSFLTVAQHARLITMLHEHFYISADARLSIELDPRHVDRSYLAWLAELGYTRISLGVQDTDARVQQAINRVQSTQHIAQLVSDAREVGISSVNLDLIYGLPHQTPETFRRTLEAVKTMAPDRISLFSYAHLPQRFAAQRKIKQDWLPQGEDKLRLMELAVAGLTDAGYQMIGMDHFALPGDELCNAKQAGRLHRNFQGYTTDGNLKILGLGVSSISATETVYSQNPRQLNAYYHRLDSHTGLTEQGIVLSADDQYRRSLINQLMCNFEVSYDAFYTRHHIHIPHYFAHELQQLETLADDGLVVVDSAGIRVTGAGKMLIRVICSMFDAYLAQQHKYQRYSRVI